MKQMSQMRAPDAPISKRTTIGEAQIGSFVRKGSVIYMLAALGKCPALLPVFADGTIAQGTDYFPPPWEEANLVSSGDLGIKELKWAPLGAKATW